MIIFYADLKRAEWVKGLGYDFTREELKQVVEGGELTDEELELIVSGGGCLFIETVPDQNLLCRLRKEV